MEWQLKGDQLIKNHTIGIDVTLVIDEGIWALNYLRSHPAVYASDGALGSGVVEGTSSSKVTQLSRHVFTK